MKYFNALLVIAFLLPLFSLAQSNYKPGYVVTSKGDTVRGFIDYQDWDSNPSSISFKSALTDRNKKEFTLENAAAIDITGFADYKKYVCSVSMDGTNASNPENGRDTSFKTETVFLRVLQQGTNLALYSYADNIKTRFYIGYAPDFAPAELVYRMYIGADARGDSRTITENDYQKQLFALATRYNALDDRLTTLLEHSGYTSDDLLQIVGRINNISKAEFEKKYTTRSKLSWCAGLALNISNTSSNSFTPYTMSGGPAHTSYLPAIKFGIDFLPDANGRVEFKADISVDFTQFSTSYKLDVNPYTGAKAFYNQTGMSLTPQILYNIYNAPDFKFYIGAGLSFTYNTYSDAAFGPENSGGYNFFSDTFPFLLKAGFRIHKNIELYFDYYTSDNITNNGYFGFKNENKQVGINYYFGK